MILISNSILGQMSYKPSKYIEIEDFKINYTESGSGMETLLFLHGFVNSTYAWDNITKNLDTTKFRIICIDILGFGFSDKPLNADYSIEKQSKVVKDNGKSGNTVSWLWEQSKFIKDNGKSGNTIRFIKFKFITNFKFIL